jgi:hypothetical protein
VALCKAQFFEREKAEGLQQNITSREFPVDLQLLCDALQELAEMSLHLQECSMDLYKVDQNIKALVQISEERQALIMNVSPNVPQISTCGEFSLHRRDLKNNPPTDLEAFNRNFKKQWKKGCSTVKMLI